MKPRRSNTGAWIAFVIVAALTGWWLGRRSSPDTSTGIPMVSALACPVIPACGPATPIAPVAGEIAKQGRVAQIRTVTSPLPRLDETEADRERLLQYIRERASGLEECAKDSRDRLRLTVKLDVASKGTVKHVQVMDDDPAHRKAGQCVAQRMGEWRLPEEWVKGDRTILVAVVL